MNDLSAIHLLAVQPRWSAEPDEGLSTPLRKSSPPLGNTSISVSGRLMLTGWEYELNARQAGGNPAPTVTSISPTSGTANGGTAVTITGAGFFSGATVSIGGTGATGVTVANSTSIGATTPVHTAGAVSVVVTNTDRQSGALANGYTYTSSLGLKVPPGDPNSATVIAGQAASYTLSLGGAGTSGSAAVSCTGAPTGANCAVPASETFSANVPVTFSVTVRTTSRTIGALHPPASAPTPWSWPLAMTMLGIVVLPGTRAPSGRCGGIFGSRR